MKKKYAFVLMGREYQPDIHRARFESARQITYICTVRDLNGAVHEVEALWRQGIGAIELCGAFGREDAERMRRLTTNEVAIGYVVHEPCMDDAFDKFFSERGR